MIMDTFSDFERHSGLYANVQILGRTLIRFSSIVSVHVNEASRPATLQLEYLDDDDDEILIVTLAREGEHGATVGQLHEMGELIQEQAREYWRKGEHVYQRIYESGGWNPGMGGNLKSFTCDFEDIREAVLS